MPLRSKIPATDIKRGNLLGEARVAYTLIETARIRCEALARRSAKAEALRTIHRNLGLAGYHASNDFAAELRERSLADAHRSCDDELGTDTDPARLLESIFNDVLSACDAFAFILTQRPDTEMQTAQTYALSAAALLDSRVN